MVSRSTVFVSGLWVAAAAVATSIGLLAVHVVGVQVGPPSAAPLTRAAVRDALTAVSPNTHPVPSTTTARPHAIGAVQTVSTQGGVVGARCGDGEPLLVYAAPAVGYTTIRTNPDEVDFASSRSDIAISLSCENELLVVQATEHRSAPIRPAPVTPTRQTQQPPDQTTSPEPTDRPENPAASAPAHSGSTPGLDG